MNSADDLLAANDRYAADFPFSDMPAKPTGKLIIVTCMDTRLEPLASLGLQVGEAHVVRNAGGVVTDDVLRSVLISQRYLGTEHVAIIQHTDCGMMKIDEQQARAEIAAAAGVDLPFALEAFDDLDASIQRSVQRLLSSPFIEHKNIRGFAYNVTTGRLREVL